MPAKETVKKAPRKPPNAGKGRPKGVPNKSTAKVKEAILRAFDEAGGHKYLMKVAKDDPKTFCALLGRILPAEISAEVNGDMSHSVTFNMVYHPPKD
jgi:hypothetical protein